MHQRHALATLIICALLICSCSQAAETPQHTVDVARDARAEAEALQTTVAVAVEATLTMIASLRTAVPTNTLVPTVAPTATSTREPIPTAPAPTSAPTVDLSGCTPDSHYESDITIPDNTEIAFSTAFTKTWEVTNNGTCDWGEGFYLKHAGGDRLGGPESAPVPEVKAGETVQVSVRLIAPDKPGTYVSKWQICAEGYQCFGAVLFAKIVAVAP